MNVEEKVATLEALLARVQNNAARPRVPRPGAPPEAAAEPNGGARLAAAVEKPVVAATPTPTDPLDAELEMLLEAKLTKPAEAKIAKVVEPRIEKVVEPKVEKVVEAKIDALDAWTEALQKEAPKAADKPPVIAPAKPDESTPKPAPIAARTTTPAAIKAIAPRPVTPAPRPVAPRSPFGSRSEPTPSPTPTAAKVPEGARVVEKIEPAITPPKPVEKVDPVVAAPAPAEKIAPVVATAKPAEKVAPVVATAKPAEKVAPTKAADDEIRFDFDTPPPLPKKAEAAVTEKAEAAVVPAPPTKMPPLPAKPVEAKALDADDDLVTHDDETMLMNGTIPEPEPPTIVDDTTSDEETVVVTMAKAGAEIDDDEPTTVAPDSGDSGEATHVFEGRASRPEAASPAPAKVEIEVVSAPKIDDVKVVVSPSLQVPALAENAEVPVAAVKVAEVVAPPVARASDAGELTAPSRRYTKPDNDPLEALPMNGGKRSSMVTLGLVAAALIGAGVFVGLRNGWFEGTRTPVVPTTPTASTPAPVVSATPITTASAAPILSAAPTTSAAVPAPTTSASAAPTASASAAATASAAPIASASAAPTASAAPAVTGDGTNLPFNRGYVIINSAKRASVFLTGNFAGTTGAKLEVECGAKFLRLAAPPVGAERPATPDWTSDGRSISVACRSITTVTFEATR